MNAATYEFIGSKPCKVCGTNVVHARLALGDASADIPTVSHKAPCGLWCGYDSTDNLPDGEQHGGTPGKCPECGDLK